MFNKLKQIIGTKELIKEQVGHYFYYGNCVWDILNDDLNFIDSKRIETLFFISTYATNSMKLTIESIKGKKEYQLEKQPEVIENFLSLSVSDFDTKVSNIRVFLDEDVVFFRMGTENKGFYFSKENLVEGEVDKTPISTTNKNETDVSPLKNIIINLINTDLYLAKKFKDEFKEDLNKMVSCIVNQTELEKYNWYFKVCGEDKAQALLYDELNETDIKSLPIKGKEIEDFKKLQERIYYHRCFSSVTDDKEKTLLDYLYEYRDIK